MPDYFNAMYLYFDRRLVKLQNTLLNIQGRGQNDTKKFETVPILEVQWLHQSHISTMSWAIQEANICVSQHSPYSGHANIWLKSMILWFTKGF